MNKRIMMTMPSFELLKEMMPIPQILRPLYDHCDVGPKTSNHASLTKTNVRQLAGRYYGNWTAFHLERPFGYVPLPNEPLSTQQNSELEVTTIEWKRYIEPSALPFPAEESQMNNFFNVIDASYDINFNAVLSTIIDIFMVLMIDSGRDDI
eukprot:Gb_33994 [translate_table: standard]